MFSWQLLVILYLVFYAAFNILSRLLLQHTRYENAYTMIWQFFLGLTAVCFLPFQHPTFAFPFVVFLFIICNGLLYNLVNVFRFKAYKYEEASALAPIFTTMNLFTVLFSIIFFRSPISLATIAGIIIITFAAVIAVSSKHKIVLSKGILFAIACSVLSGMTIAIEGHISKYIPTSEYLSLLVCVELILGQLFILRPKISEIIFEFKTQGIKIALSASLLCLSALALIGSFAKGNVTEIVAFSATATLLVTILGIVLLKERDRVVIKLLATIVAVLGVIIISKQ